MERQCWSNAQYSRRECIEVVDIPDSVDNSELEVKVLTVFQKIGCELSPQDLEARPWGMPFSWENRFSNTRDNRL